MGAIGVFVVTRLASLDAFDARVSRTSSSPREVDSNDIIRDDREVDRLLIERARPERRRTRGFTHHRS